MARRPVGGGYRWLDLSEPRWRAHFEALAKGGIRFGQRRAGPPEPEWFDLTRRQKRLWLFCNHGIQNGPWLEIGGLTRDRVYAATGTGAFAGQDKVARLPCARCGAIWLAPHSGLLTVARGRGGKPARRLASQIPGVSLEVRSGSTRADARTEHATLSTQQRDEDGVDG